MINNNNNNKSNHCNSNDNYVDFVAFIVVIQGDYLRACHRVSDGRGT
jgi:hypothetical protein